MRSSLALHFARTQRLDPRLTFSRAGSAMYFGRDGLLKTAQADEPAFEYDPTTRRCRGILLESARTNLVANTNLDTSPWGPVRASIAASAATAPDGTLTAFKLVENTSASASHYVQIPSFTTLPTSGYVTVSLFVKAAERSRIRLNVVHQGGTSTTLQFNLNTLAVSQDVASATSQNSGAVSFTATWLPNGWYRLSVTAAGTSGGSTPALQIVLVGEAGSMLYTGDGTSGLYLWGPQVEAGAAPSSYIPTAGTEVTRPATTLTMPTDSRWYQDGIGTLRVKAELMQTSAYLSNSSIISLGNITDYVRLLYDQTFPRLRAVVGVGGVSILDTFNGFVPGATLAYSPFTFASALSPTSIDVAANGATSATIAATGTLPTVNLFTFGGSPTGLQLNGWLDSVAYYPVTRSLADLVALTR